MILQKQKKTMVQNMAVRWSIGPNVEYANFLMIHRAGQHGGYLGNK